MRENHSDCSRVAQHASVLGPSGHVQPNPIVPAQPTDSAAKEQGFFEAVLAEIEAPQESQPDQSMRQVDHFNKVVQQ